MSEPLLLELDRLRAIVRPDLGAGVSDLSLRAPDGSWCPVWRPAPRETNYFNDLASYTLAPWSNRVAGARFGFKGRSHALRPDWKDGTAIHGDVKHRAFSLLDRSPVSARLRYDSRAATDTNFPWPYACDTRYELGLTAGRPWLLTELSVRNHSPEPMPVGVGFHPYFLRTLWNASDRVVVQGNFTGRYPAVGMIPTGPAAPDSVTAHLQAGRPLGALDLDDVFTCPSSDMLVRWPGSGVTARFECSSNLSHAVLYSPLLPDKSPAPFFCLEPVSMVNDGFNLLDRGWTGTGVEVLAPGEVFEVSWKLVFDIA